MAKRRELELSRFNGSNIMKEFSNLPIQTNKQLVTINGKKYTLRKTVDGKHCVISKTKALENWIRVGPINKPEYVCIFNQESQDLINKYLAS